MTKFNKAVNAIYDYIYDVEPDQCKCKLDELLQFVIGLRHSFVDNDKPKSNYDINMDILRMAELSDLKVNYVQIKDKLVDLKER